MSAAPQQPQDLDHQPLHAVGRRLDRFPRGLPILGGIACGAAGCLVAAFADTVPLHDKKIQRLEVCSVAQLLARAIDAIHRSESVSKLFASER